MKSIRIDLPNGRFKGPTTTFPLAARAHDYIGALVDFRLHERFAGNGEGLEVTSFRWGGVRQHRAPTALTQGGSASVLAETQGAVQFRRGAVQVTRANRGIDRDLPYPRLQ